MPGKFLKKATAALASRFRRWTFRPYTVKRDISGETIFFRVGDLFGEAVYNSSKHDFSRECDWIKEHGIRAGNVVVDCGANHGFATVLFAKWAGPMGSVHAVEPSGHNVSILRANVRLNGLQNVLIHQTALGSAKGKAGISLHSNASIVPFAAGGRCETVSMERLDDLLPSERIDFIKIDVEGFEIEILKGASRILATAPRLDLELHLFMYERKVERLREIFSLLPMDRYVIDVQHEIEGPISGYDPHRDSLEALSACDVVHLFCRKRCSPPEK